MSVRLSAPRPLTLAAILALLLLIQIVVYALNWQSALLATLALTLVLVALLFRISWLMGRRDRLIAAIIFPAITYVAMHGNAILLRWVVTGWAHVDEIEWIRFLPIYSFFFLLLAPAVIFLLNILLLLAPPEESRSA